ncbi:hypothetical protein [Streptomyces sp. NPDC001594]
MERGITAFISASAVRRWPAEAARKPCQNRSWIFLTDLGFRIKAGRVLHL